jgi:hypothetical protein
MTAAGLALIAGGIATLIGFRHVLLGRSEPAPRGERRRGASPVTVPSQIRARRRRQALAALPAAPTRAAIEAPAPTGLSPSSPTSLPPFSSDLPSARADEPKHAADLPSFPVDEPKHAADLPSFPVDEPKRAAEAAVTRSGKAGRRSARARTFMSRAASKPGEAVAGEAPFLEAAATGTASSAEGAGDRPGGEPWGEERVRTRGRRQSRAKDIDGPTQSVKTRFAPRGIVDEPTGPVAAVPATSPDRKRPAREGDRIEGWVRPEYEDEASAAGDYWTPVPEQSYGWPTPVQRLPEAPPYPSSRFEPIEKPEPTSALRFGPVAEEIRPTLFGRIEAPSSSGPVDASRPDPVGAEAESAAGPEAPAQDGADSQPEPTGAVPAWPPAQPSGRIELPPSWSARKVQQRPVRRSAEPVSAEPENPPRTRPRPRPRPAAGAPAERSTVYRSRHAADPS